MTPEPAPAFREELRTTISAKFGFHPYDLGLGGRPWWYSLPFLRRLARRRLRRKLRSP